MSYLTELDPDNPLRPLQAASCTYPIALWPRTSLNAPGCVAPHDLAILPLPGPGLTAHNEAHVSTRAAIGKDCLESPLWLGNCPSLHRSSANPIPAGLWQP